MNNRRPAATLVAAAMMATCVTIVSATASTPPRHIRGTVAAVEVPWLTVRTSPDNVAPVMLAHDAKVFTVAPADFSAIKPGKYVGVTSVERNGRREAVEVHVFDESLRGRGEGDRPWDLASGPGRMTNANIARVEAVGRDRVLTLAYKGGSRTITVPPDATIVTITPGTANEIRPGEQVFITAHGAPEGRLVGASIAVGQNGLKPPM